MATFPQTPSSALAAQPAQRCWLVAGASLVLSAVALLAVFPAESTGAYRVWMESTAYNHCLLVLPVALYIAWSRREVFQVVSPHPDLRAVLLLLPLGMVWLAAATVSVLEAQQLVVLSMFQVMALAILGWRAYRALMAPFLYLFFLVPTGYFLVPSLQDFTSGFAVAGIKLAGIPFFSDGTFIEVPSGSFVVAEACAGLRFLIASVAFGVLFSVLMYRSYVRRMLFIALSIVVPIIANGIRAFGIIAASEIVGNAQAVEADHIIYGWGFFTLVTLLLIAIGMKFADEGGSAPPRGDDFARGREARPIAVALAAILALAVAATGPAYAMLRDRHSPAAGLATLAAPEIAPPWIRTESIAESWRPVMRTPDREFVDSFSDGVHTATRYLALYDMKGFHSNLIRSVTGIADETRLQVVEKGQAIVQFGGRDETVSVSEVLGQGRKLLVWHFYVVDGQVVPSPSRAKLAQLKGLIGHHEELGAFMAVAVNESGIEQPSDILKSFFAASPSLRPYLQLASAKSR
jgi:exosortase A